MMHEQVHQRTCQQERVWQGAEYMGGMLGHQEKHRDKEKATQDNPNRTLPPWPLDIFTHWLVPSVASSRLHHAHGSDHQSVDDFLLFIAEGGIERLGSVLEGLERVEMRGQHLLVALKTSPLFPFPSFERTCRS